MTTMMREFPQLPLLSLEQSTEVIKRSGIPTAQAARILGYTRMQVHRWLHGRVERPLDVTLNTISALAYRLLRVERDNAFPKGLKAREFKLWVMLLDDRRYGIPLRDTHPLDLLPPAWAVAFNLPPRIRDVAEPVLPETPAAERNLLTAYG
jgi:transcriptional regulator with XRE-family HTH domain